METNFKLYKKCRNILFALISLGAIITALGFIMKGLSMCIAGLLGILIFSAWCIVLKDNFNRHLKLMEEHGVKGPREIVSWLLSAREKEQEDLLTYLHRDDLSKICDAFLIHIENYPEDTKAKSVYQRLKIFV